MLEGLLDAGFSPDPLDLPGHGSLAGESDAADFTLDATLSRLAAARGGPGPVVGYSMGGRVALHFAARVPETVTHLVLESASPGLATPAERADRRAADEALARRIVSEGVAAFVDEWEALPLFASQNGLRAEVREALRRRRLSNDVRSLAASLLAVGTGALPSLWDRLPHIDVPTLIVVGQLDDKFRTIGEKMVEALPRADLVVVAGAGHAVHLERPRAWCEAVTDFLRGGDASFG